MITREEAQSEAYKKYVTDGTIGDDGAILINKIYDDFEKEIAQLKKDRDYWKFSFNKQVEAGRK